MRTRPALTLASLTAMLAGCGDHDLPSEPRNVAPNVTVYSVTVQPPVTLGGLAGSTQDIAIGINGAGDITGESGGRTVVWSTGTAVAPQSTSPDEVDFGRGIEINALGQIAGERGGQAALWTPNTSGGGYTRTDIGSQLPGSIVGTAWAINDGGQVVGNFRTLEGGVLVWKCFLWTPGVPNGTVGAVSVPASDFGGGFCTANDINSAGTIAGASNLLSGGSHAFVWSGSGALTDLTPGGEASYGSAINDGGQVAGWRVTSPTIGGVLNAAVWTPGPSGWSVADLGTFGRDESMAMDINDAGFVIAFARINATAVDEAFFWQNGSATPLPGVAGYSTAPNGALHNVTSAGVVLVAGASTNVTTAERIALRWAVTLTPATPQGCIASLVTLIGQMQTAGTLRAGEAKSLLAKLDAATRQLDQGRTTPAANLLEAFISEVSAAVAAGRLSAAEAQPLIDGARCALAAL